MRFDLRLRREGSQRRVHLLFSHRLNLLLLLGIRGRDAARMEAQDGEERALRDVIAGVLSGGRLIISRGVQSMVKLLDIGGDGTNFSRLLIFVVSGTFLDWGSDLLSTTHVGSAYLIELSSDGPFIGGKLFYAALNCSALFVFLLIKSNIVKQPHELSPQGD